MKLIFSPTFTRATKRLLKKNKHFSLIIQATLKIMETDLFSPNLRTHKLKGKFEGCWSCSADYNLRIIFKIVRHENEDAILLQTIGTHDEVY